MSGEWMSGGKITGNKYKPLPGSRSPKMFGRTIGRLTFGQSPIWNWIRVTGNKYKPLPGFEPGASSFLFIMKNTKDALYQTELQRQKMKKRRESSLAGA